MRKTWAGLLALLVLVFALGGIASSEPIDSGSASAGGWHITGPTVAGQVLVGEATLVPTVSATYPCATPPCEDSQNLVGAAVGTLASADVLFAEAQAFEESDATATLQTIMDNASAIALPTNWNTRGYARLTGFSALGGRITADVVEAETVFGSQPGANVSTSGVSIQNLAIAGFLPGVVLAPFDPLVPNQELLDEAGIRIVYWETNWDPATGTTTDGQPIFVNALRITEAATGTDIRVSTATTNAVFRPPVAVDDSASTPPGTALEINVAANDTDPDGNLNPASVTITQGAANGTVTCNDPAKPGFCTYTPNAGFTGTDTFTYRICDTTGVCDTAVVTVTVVPPGNDPPVANDDSPTTPYEQAVVINVTANDTDPEGNLVQTSVSVTSPPASGTLNCVNNLCTFTPANGFAGIVTFTYQVCDNVNQCDSATVTITVTNQPPTANNDTAGTQIGDPVVIDVVGNDSDPEGELDVATTNVTQNPANGTATCDDAGQCTYVPNANFVGSDQFTYEVCDNLGQCDTAIVTVTVTNAPPVATDDAATTDEGSSVSIPVLTNDSDPDGNLVPGTLTVTLQPADGAVSCSLGSCTYTPDPGFDGIDTFEYRVCDSRNLCDTAVVTVTVNNVVGGGGGGGNLPPVANDDAANTNVGTTVAINVIANDSDPENQLVPTSVTVVDGPDQGSVICSNGTCYYTPVAGYTGPDTFEYQVCDAQNQCATAVVTITVSGVPAGSANQPPDANDDARTTNEDTSVTINVLANDSDPDGNIVQTAAIVQPPASGSVICNGTSCTYTPAPGFSGTETFTYRVCDSDNACDTATVTITVVPAGGGNPNQPPVAQDDAGSTTQDSPVVIDVTQNDSDPDNNLSDTVAVVNPPSNGAVICNDGDCTYTPAPGFSGTDEFDYRICDTAAVCDTATVTITVAAPVSNNTGGGNSPPVANNDSVTTDGGTPVVITVLPNDSDPDGNLDNTTVAITRPPANGAVICSGGTCTYTPEPGYSGPDSFEYRVCDTLNVCDTATVNIIVSDTDGSGDNRPPVARNDSVTSRPGQPVTINVTNNDSDPDGDLDLTTVTVTVPPDNGSVICIEGRCTYTPDRGFEGQDDFEYRVCDALGACTTAVVTVNVPAPNPNIGNGGGGGGGGPGGGGPGNNHGGGGPAGQDDDPALPGDTPPNAPISLDNPLLGAPKAPLPFTGGDPSFYLGAALNLLLIGMLLVLIERFTRASRSLKPCPAWHKHEQTKGAVGCAYGEWVQEPRIMLAVIARFRSFRHAPEPCPAWHNHEETDGSHGCAYGEWS